LSALAGYHYKAYQSPPRLCITQEGGSDLPDTSPLSSTPATKLYTVLDLFLLVLTRKKFGLI